MLERTTVAHILHSYRARRTAVLPRRCLAEDDAYALRTQGQDCAPDCRGLRDGHAPAALHIGGQPPSCVARLSRRCRHGTHRLAHQGAAKA